MSLSHIPIYKPYLPAKSLIYAHQALDSSWVSSQGPYIQQAQEQLQEFLGVKHILLTNNGTSAGHLMSHALEFQYPHIKKILVPNNVYVAAWNTLLQNQKLTLIAVPCSLDTWNYDLEALERYIQQYPEAAVLIVHNIGNIINVPQLQRKFPQTIFLEDACEAFTGKHEEQYTGTASLVSSFSGFANKTITGGEIGWIATNNTDIFSYLKCIYSQGQSVHTKFLHDYLGYNYRASNPACALLKGQLDILSEILSLKQNIFNRYKQELKNISRISFQANTPNTQNGHWMFGVRIEGSQYQKIKSFFDAHNIETRQMFFPIYKHSYLTNNPSLKYTTDPIAEQLNNECAILPSYPELSVEEQDRIIDIITKYVKIL